MAHDYTYLIKANLEWLERYLELSKSRLDNKPHHEQVQGVIDALKGYDENDPKSREKVQLAFAWIAKNIWKLWC